MENSIEFDSQWCHPVQSFGPFTEVVNNEGNTCMSLAPAAVFCLLQEARKWVNHGKRQRVHLIWWLKYDENWWNMIKSVWVTDNHWFPKMNVNDLAGVCNTSAPLRQLRAGLCPVVGCGLMLFVAKSSFLFLRQPHGRSFQECWSVIGTSKAESQWGERFLTWLYSRFGM